MIIGINGKLGSGKDTVGKIIQGFIAHSEGKITEGEILEVALSNILYWEENDWQIKKFAAKLKQIASILTGIPVEDFEKQEVKDSYLSEEWDYYELISNDTKFLNPVATLESFFAIKTSIKFSNLYEYNIWCQSRGVSTLNYSVIHKRYTVRQFLQELGTEAIRNIIHPNAHVNALMCDYKKTFTGKDAADHFVKNDGTSMELQYPNWIITDMRFPNEYDAVKVRGITICVQRWFTDFSNCPNKDIDINTNEDGIEYEYWGVRYENGRYYTSDNECIIEEVVTHWRHNITKAHISETALDLYKFDYVINNDGTIEELIEKVKEILIKEKIINGA